MRSNLRLVLSLALAALALNGCSLLEPKKIDYKSAGTVPSLEVPPDLTAPSSDERYAVPDSDSAGPATYSAYSMERKEKPASTTLLPEQEKARIERAGSQRWLVVSATPEQVWPVLKDFWQELGFIVNLESKETGVMETDWAENRAKIPQDIIRSTLGKVIDGLYSTPERDKFRTRVEKAANGGTEIYISHRGMYEVYATEGKDKTVWEPRPADPDLEAEMLRRLMLRFGVEEARAETLLAKQQAPEMARIVGNDLEMDEAFDRAWRRVGLALDRIGFAVEDRDRSKGIYFVRYIDPQVDNASKRDEGVFARFAFWRSKQEQTSPRVQIRLAETGDKTRVDVGGVEGKAVDPATQKRILNLLYKELK